MAPVTLPRRAFLGAELPGDTEAFTGGGVRIAGAFAGGMAARAGLCAGDLLVAIAGFAVPTLPALGEALRAAGAQPTATLAYVRDGVRAECAVDVVAASVEAGAELGELAVLGARLRTLAVVPPSPRALVLVIQGIACESVELQPDTPLAALVEGWAAAGIASLRFDKRGVGDSDGGPGNLVDFTTELAGARAALDLARTRAAALGVPLAVFGHSVGGIIAAILAGEPQPPAGVMVYGTPVMRWFDCLGDSIRRQLALRGAPEADIARALANLDTLARDGELNGRSAAYHRQLHALDLEATWRGVASPCTLVLRGEHDWVVRAEDQARIARLVGSVAAAIVDLPGLDHLFGRHADRAASLRDYGAGLPDPAIARATATFLAMMNG